MKNPFNTLFLWRDYNNHYNHFMTKIAYFELKAKN